MNLGTAQAKKKMKKNANSTLPAIAAEIVVPTMNSKISRLIELLFHMLICRLDLLLILAREPADENTNKDCWHLHHQEQENSERNNERKRIVEKEVKVHLPFLVHENIISKSLAAGNCTRE